jgi:hypothetical protein
MENQVRLTSRPTLTTSQKMEIERCKVSLSYFISFFVQIYNATDRDWIPFDLWGAQKSVIRRLRSHRLTIVLKARQLGLSWLTLAYALWLMRFHPIVTILIFSKRDDEASELLGRIVGMEERLPDWLRIDVTINNEHEFELSNGSKAHAFPTTGGRSYTGSLVILDEADFMPDLDALLNAVKPTIDAGGQMVAISTSDKSRPESAFKRIYRAAKAQRTEWVAIFLAWSARPGRTEEWYEIQKVDIEERTGSLDDLHQEYPATDAEALAPRELDKRIPARWLLNVYAERAPLSLLLFSEYQIPSIPNLELYRPATAGHRYVIGADPAEGNPNSDPSALTCLDVDTGEEVAAVAGRFEPSSLGDYIDQLSLYFNKASYLIERNNHGHAVLLWLDEHGHGRRLKGYDGKVGWNNNVLGKKLLYTTMADCARDGHTTLHSAETFTQLASIEASTLSAPEQLHDDRATSYALAVAGREMILERDERAERPQRHSSSI